MKLPVFLDILRGLCQSSKDGSTMIVKGCQTILTTPLNCRGRFTFSRIVNSLWVKFSSTGFMRLVRYTGYCIMLRMLSGCMWTRSKKLLYYGHRCTNRYHYMTCFTALIYNITSYTFHEKNVFPLRLYACWLFHICKLLNGQLNLGACFGVCKIK